MLAILTLANLTRDDLADALRAEGFAGTTLDSAGFCDPWPPEVGATALLSGLSSDDLTRLRVVAANLCRDRGEECAALTVIPFTTFTLIAASDKE